MAEKLIAETEELPKAIVRRLVKEKLSSLSREGDISILKEALLAFSKSARIFIHYLSATSFDICRESRRQTINAEDVFKALEEIEFTEFIGPLRASLEEFRQKNAGKRSKSTMVKEKEKEGTNKKRKGLPVETEEVEKETEENDEEEDEEEMGSDQAEVLPVENEEVEEDDDEEEDDEGKQEEETNKKRKVLPVENEEEEDDDEE